MIAGGQDAYDFRDPIDLAAIAAKEPLFAAVAETAAFQRLMDIRFLGGIDYLLVRTPNGTPGHRRYTRYQHSLGVAYLAYVYSVERGLPPQKRRLACAAALLHDIGHAPLSHTLEGVFKKAFGMDHHAAGEQVVKGGSPFGSEVVEVLRAYSLDVDEVLAVASGEADEFDGFFGGPINFDTIEGILRSWAYLRPKAPSLDPRDVMLAALRRDTDADRQTVDKFWEYKDQVYRYIIRSEFGVAADWVCEEALQAQVGRLATEDYFLTEKRLFSKVPELRRILVETRIPQTARAGGEALRYTFRTFTTDERYDFFTHDDSRRYRQWKEDRVMQAPDAQFASLPKPTLPDFFDDLSISADQIEFRKVAR